MKLFQIITLLFCLGIFLVPKDNFYAQNRQETCCKSDSEISCCKKEHQQHPEENQDKEGKQSSCNDDCCSTCITCCTYIETPCTRTLQSDIAYYLSDKNLPFEYSDPYFSDRLKEIWQPPKIG